MRCDALPTRDCPSRARLIVIHQPNLSRAFPDWGSTVGWRDRRYSTGRQGRRQHHRSNQDRRPVAHALTSLKAKAVTATVPRDCPCAAPKQRAHSRATRSSCGGCGPAGEGPLRRHGLSNAGRRQGHCRHTIKCLRDSRWPAVTPHIVKDFIWAARSPPRALQGMLSVRD